MSTHIQFGGWIFAFLVIAGFIILGVAIAVAMTRNRVSRSEEREIDRATNRMYDEQNQDDRMRGDP